MLDDSHPQAKLSIITNNPFEDPVPVAFLTKFKVSFGLVLLLEELPLLDFVLLLMLSQIAQLSVSRGVILQELLKESSKNDALAK